jgi:hypothetical protein
MSLPSVRSAVAAYISAAAIPNLTYVYASQPYDLEDVDWRSLTTAGSTTDAVAIVYVDNDEDEVIAFDGAGGRRQVTYEVSVECLVWDVDVSANPTSTTGQEAYDAIVAAVKSRLRTDPQLGTAATPGIAGNDGIIQAAIDRLQGEYGRPVRLGNGDAWACWFAVRFGVQTYEFST